MVGHEKCALRKDTVIAKKNPVIVERTRSFQNREISDKKEIAETFNSYFVNVAPNASIPESKTSF